MSFDLNLPVVCNHRLYKELTTLEADRRSLRVSKPIAASNIDVFASDDLLPKTEYVLIFDPRTLTVNQPRMIFLNEKWKSVEDYFQVSYVTIGSYCPKCIGLNSIDDISYDVKGSLAIARNEKLLLQNLEKFTVTEINSNPFHKYIGTALVNLLGERITDVNYMATKIIQEINTSLGKFKDMQDQYRLSKRPVTDGESLQTINNIAVNVDENDPEILRADVTVTAKSGKSVDFAQYLKIPEVR